MPYFPSPARRGVRGEVASERKHRTKVRCLYFLSDSHFRIAGRKNSEESISVYFLLLVSFQKDRFQ